MQLIWQDLRYALRLLLKSPGYTAIVVLIIALGVGANAAIFSFVNALLLRPLEAVTNPESLAQVLRTNDNNISEIESFRDCRDFQEQNRTLAGMAMHWRATLHLSAGREVERLEGALVSGGYFELLGVKPALGRLFTPTDVQAEGSDSIVVLSHNLWRNRFGRDQGVIGRTVSLNGFSYTVIGIAAEGFRGVVTGERADVWIPATMWRQADPEMANAATTWKLDWFGMRDAAWLKAFGRLKPGATIEQAQADLTAIAQRLEREYPETNQKVGVRLAAGLGLPPSARDHVSRFVKLPTVIAGIVLLIVCANVAGMMLTRAVARQKEIGVRLALGASRWLIVRQLLAEGLLLAIAGGLLGLFFSRWLGGWLRTSLPESYLSMPLKFEVALDMRVFGFTLAITVLTGLLSALAPAWQSSQLDLIPLLKDKPGRGGPVGRFRLGEFLIVAQVTLSLALLVAAGLCVRTLHNARAIDTGFDTDRVLTARIDLGRQNYTEAQGQVFYQRLLERMEMTPGVEAASLALNVPLSGPQMVTRIFPEGRPPEGGRLQVSHNVVTPGYLETVGIKLLLGRHFSALDHPQAPRVAIINETLARRYWPDENPIGKRFRFGENSPDALMIEIVGLASDTKVANLFAALRMYLYLPFAQRHQDRMVLHLRTAGATEQLAAPLRHEIAALDRSLPVYEIKTLTDYRDAVLTPQRLAALLISGLGALALLLAAISLYGRMSYDVERRMREIGIRMALGAQARDVFRLIIKRGVGLTLIGVGVGLVVAIALTRLIKALLFGVSATDPLTLTAISTLLIAVGTLACYFPARRATNADPIKSLRCE